MAALDTNVLVRWLTDDDADQCALVDGLLDVTAEKEQRLFVSVTVVLETEWVLRSRYRFDKPALITALDALLGVAELEFQHESALEQALWHFKQLGSADFADCLHLALAAEAGRLPLWTFDARAAKLEGVALLGAQP
jgi:predicted nucleic-acid-binding protein